MKSIAKELSNIQQQILDANTKIEEMSTSLMEQIVEEQSFDSLDFSSEEKNVTARKTVNGVLQIVVFNQNDDAPENRGISAVLVGKAGAAKDVDDIAELDFIENVDRFAEQMDLYIKMEIDLHDLSYFAYAQ